MQQYLSLMREILEFGEKKRIGPEPAPYRSSQSRCDLTLSAGFPLLTTKKLHLRSIIHELLLVSFWGHKHPVPEEENRVRIWDEWADQNGDLGPVYGKQWRSFPSP